MNKKDTGNSLFTVMCHTITFVDRTAVNNEEILTSLPSLPFSPGGPLGPSGPGAPGGPWTDFSGYERRQPISEWARY